MIASCADIVCQSLVVEIKNAVYFSICMDTTPDAGNVEQLSFVIRFVTDSGDVIEALLEMTNAPKANAEGLFEQLTDMLKKYNLSMENIRGQGYDGCSVMPGPYTGLQARVREHCSMAYFVHCYAHRLNLVMVDTCCDNVISRNFWDIVQQLYNFVEGSCQRHGLFKDMAKCMLQDQNEDNDVDGYLNSTGVGKCYIL